VLKESASRPSPKERTKKKKLNQSAKELKEKAARPSPKEKTKKN
jgi:hypothetical protein